MHDEENPRVLIDPHHAQARRALAELAGAAAATLHAINTAGGHVIADERHQAPIEHALRVLAAALESALNTPAIRMELEENNG